jgi:hypothetical protein
MNLPNYFLADLPPEATLSPSMLAEACQTLKRNRAQYLAPRSTESLIRTLTEVASRWRSADYPLRRCALEQAPQATGFHAATIGAGLDAFFAEFTRENLVALVEQELGHARRLDQLSTAAPEERTRRAALAKAPEMIFHITAGNLPNPALLSMALGVLLRSAQFIKCAQGGSLLPRLFAHSLYEQEPKLGACLEVAEWHGGNELLESVLLAEADCVTATGTDETLAAIRARVPGRTRFLGYGHRVSFGLVTSEFLSGQNVRRAIERAATDVVSWNQMGCLSPHVIYVQTGATVPPELFAQLLADELAQRELTTPRGELPVEVAAGIASRRAIYEMRAAHSPDTRLWCSPNSTAWTVVYEADPRFQASCLNRFIYIKPVADLTELLQAADRVRGVISTVGLAAPEDRVHELVSELAHWGATRICPLGRMQNPPLMWRHDGRPALADLITWTDWEL